MGKFPQNFLWGGAIAANQYEGAYNLDKKGLYGGHRQRVGDVGITGLAFLSSVQLLRRAIGVLDQ